MTFTDPTDPTPATFVDPSAPAGQPIDEIVCSCAQVFGPDPDDGTYAARVMIAGRQDDLAGYDTVADAWLSAAAQFDRIGEHALAAECERLAGKRVGEVQSVRLPDRVDRHGGKWDTRPGIPAPVLPRGGGDPAALWADGLSEWEAHEMRRAFDQADDALRYVLTSSAEMLRALHEERESALRFRMNDPIAARLGEFSAAIARLDAFREVIRHRRVLAAKYGTPPVEQTDT